MKRYLQPHLTASALLVCCLWAGPVGLVAQPQLSQDNLPQRVPKTPRPQPTQTPSVPSPTPEVSAEDENDTVLVERLVGIVIVKTRQEVKEEGVTGVSGLQVHDIPLLSGPDFEKLCSWYLGWSASYNDIRSLENDIILYCRRKNHPLVDVIMPPQDFTSGVIQLWFLEGRVGSISVDNPGRKWFSDMYIMDQMRLHTNDTVNLKTLTEDLDWVNHNPFRQVNVVFQARTNITATAEEALGKTDVILQVDDRLPLRGYVGYENTGTEFTGQDRLLAGFNWGKAFGLDQMLNYQYTTDVNFDHLWAHSASYLVPLPWRHNLALLGAYAKAKAEFPESTAVSEGNSWQASMRYTIPKRVSMSYIHELSCGFDFKNTDNDLEFGGQTALSSTRVQVDQFQLGYSGLLMDPWGQTSFGLEGFYSPGDLTADNTDEAFNQLRPDSKANYLYGRLNFERITRLPRGFSWILHGFGQLSTQRLTPSEEMGIGGYGTVRGYGNRIIQGDDGWVLNNEIRTPVIPLLKGISKFPWDDRLQFLVFFDYGSVTILDFNNSDASSGLEPTTNLSSVGGGLRYALRQNVTIRFDYGFQLINREPNDHSGPSVGVLVSF